MKINHNMSAMVANKRLLWTEKNLSKSVERLSTGLRINRASDDAAGMASIASIPSREVLRLPEIHPMEFQFWKQRTVR